MSSTTSGTSRRRVMADRMVIFPSALLFFLFWFLVIAVFQTLKPLKTGLFVEQLGARTELYAKLANIGVAAGAVVGFSWLFERLGSWLPDGERGDGG